MKRNNLRIIGLLTAAITVVSLNLIFGRSNLARFGNNHWRHHHRYCDDYAHDNRQEAPVHLRSDTTKY